METTTVIMAIVIVVQMRWIFVYRCCKKSGLKVKTVWTLDATLARFVVIIWSLM